MGRSHNHSSAHIRTQHCRRAASSSIQRDRHVRIKRSSHHARSEALFYYFRLEARVPENHLLRLIDQHISFVFVREQLKDSYSENGRPSIDPELLLHILLGGLSLRHHQ
ncbi:MAG: hypothetical protein LAP86_30530 [Acidobacteriia bacterium]|nr:hypothetical protein [Terriglobia bacterium]